MITETVLEMHFHSPLMDLFRSSFGLGTPDGFNFFKYSPQKEAFIGFDQAYVKTELSEDDFFRTLKNAAMNRAYHLDSKYIGYFLQFKVIKEMRSRTKYTPTDITRKSHYRASLDTTKNVQTGVSQHELLFDLNSNPGALVYYACPMVFDKSELYEVDVDLTLLRLADISSCPSAYKDNDNHFVFFDEKTSPPVWCSNPVEGKAISPKELSRRLLDQAHQSNPNQAASTLLQILTNFEAIGVDRKSKLISNKKHPSILPFVSDSLTIIKLPHRQKGND